ncbi:MAG: HAD family hydrolase [Caldilineaceae bacterium]|nr:HAD family hydrolase [Caldilineaceae bacterium]
MINALIFDFDGLILDTETPEFRAWQEVYHAYHVALPLETWATCIGAFGGFDPYAYLEEQVGQPVDREAIRSTRRARFAELLANESVLPGVEQTIAEAKRRGLRLGVASSSDRAWVTGHLDRLGLAHHFTCVRTRDDVQQAKPDPALYLDAASGLGVSPAQAVALEDSPNGILAAKRAGLYCVVVPNPMTHTLSLELADLRLASLSELSLDHLLEQMASGSSQEE